ncbi:MAG TPA: Stk1 family PASTA domain-containing Ser/Thr kinase [Nocardioidaceae bacterium]|nr:Stk1 family PASTA domain-containing Ser/Thr kinase [Nocardioidaceae bacterium]
MDSNGPDPMIGRVLDGRYRVGPRIARGGMATVYEATDLRLDRVCALKIMHTGLGNDDDFAARFVREARSAAKLSHPNVVGVFDQGDDHGTLFLAMEYIPGHTLRDLIRKEAPMAPRKALALMEPVLSALAAAHQAGMIHRDVKPENVLLADDGRVKVADFGLARAVSAETQHTATGGVLIGTVSYLSPELVVDGKADARSDVYAAGVIIYEMLTGRKPHEGESPIQVAYKHVHEDVPPPSRLVPGIPAYVDALVARATARDRELRPADAQVLLHQVRRVRGALDHGILDDPELTEDLTPTQYVDHADSIDYVSEDAPTIVPTAGAAAVLAGDDWDEDGHEGTTVFRGTAAAGVLPPSRPNHPGATEDHESAGYGSRRSRKGPLLLALVLLLATMAGLAGWYYGMGRYTTTPGVINLSVEQARQKVEAAGLGFEVGRRSYSETVTAGSVISTDPEPGTNILKHGTVTATISRGPERYQVPVLRGMSLEDATAALKDTNLALGGVTKVFHPSVAEGVVIKSDPANGTEVKRGAAVDLVVSKGPRPIEVPDFTGKSAARAERVLSERGFEVKVAEENSDSVPEGKVISQTPSSGTLFRGDTVELVASKGPALVEVPAVRGVGVDEATRRLQEAGFQVQTQRSDVYVGLEFVVQSDPQQGTMAPRGSTITIFLV